MSNLENKLKELNPKLYADLQETKIVVSKLLQQYIKNFPTYTDHSIEHTQEVLNIAGNLLSKEEVNSLTSDEIYILSMACILHDIGMCIPESKIKEIAKTEELIEYRNTNSDYSTEHYIRDIHHVLSLKFINEEWKQLKIPSEKYAEAIGLVAQGHRKVDIDDFNVYDPQFFIHSGRDFICLPYLACIIRIADELDITNSRTPEILLKYYIPDNEISKKEWNKHKSTILVNFKGTKVIIQAKCTDHNMLAALEGLFDKIKDVINNCQKIIGSLQQVEDRSFSLSINSIEPKFIYQNFDPKGIKYSFEVKNVINAFVGEDLYESKDAAIREIIQNALDACNYKKLLKKDDYSPEIIINISNDTISVSDNGLGMDEFIIENYFGKLASSFYQQDSVKNEFQAIGQFGIGVFSYFLICDYIDVETKRLNKKSLKFRTDKDPNGYFHFFDDFSRKDEGSKITLYLKEKFKGTYTIERINSFLEETFPFIDVPIQLSDGKENFKLSTDEVSIDFDKDVFPHLYYNSQKTSKTLKLISVNHKNEDYEGVLSLVVPKAFNKSKVNFYDLFDRNSFENKRSYLSEFSLVAFAQKGVLINNYESRLSFSFGKVNLFRKLNVNLSRTEFTDEREVDKVLESLEAKLIQKTFDEILISDEFETIKHKNITEWFLKLYWEHSINSELINKTINRLFCFEIFNKDKNEYLSLLNISKKYKKIILFVNKNEAKNNQHIINTPYLLTDSKYGYSWDLYTIFASSGNYGYSVTKLNDLYYLSLDRDKFDELKSFQKIVRSYDIYSYFSIFEDDSIIGVNYYDKRRTLAKEETHFHLREGCRINIKHLFFIEFIKYAKINKLNSTEIRLIKELIKIMEEYFRSIKKTKKSTEVSIINANIIIGKLNEESNHKFPSLELKDFGFLI